jgi:hypothetical protein
MPRMVAATTTLLWRGKEEKRACQETASRVLKGVSCFVGGWIDAGEGVDGRVFSFFFEGLHRAEGGVEEGCGAGIQGHGG